MTRVSHFLPFATLLLAAASMTAPLYAAPLRAPAVPLVACDPYFSVWSPADKLTDTNTVHWTGKPHRLGSIVQIDGSSFRLMGAEPGDLPALPQQSVSVLPTRTIYEFAGSGIRLTLTFTTPALPDDLDILARPVTYLTWDVAATDGATHEVQLSFTARGELAVNTPDQLVNAQTLKERGLTTIKIGSVEQGILAKRGDDIRIDWGYFYVAAPTGTGNPQASIASAVGHLPAEGGSVTAAITFAPQQIGSESVSRWLILAYDDLYSIQYMKENLRPYWRRNGWDASRPAGRIGQRVLVAAAALQEL